MKPGAASRLPSLTRHLTLLQQRAGAPIANGRGVLAEPLAWDSVPIQMTGFDPDSYLSSTLPRLVQGAQRTTPATHGPRVRRVRFLGRRSRRPGSHNRAWALFSPGGRTAVVRQGGGSAAETHAGLLLDPTFTTERYRSLAFSDHQRYLTIREPTIQAMQVTGVASAPGWSSST